MTIEIEKGDTFLEINKPYLCSKQSKKNFCVEAVDGGLVDGIQVKWRIIFRKGDFIQRQFLVINDVPFMVFAKTYVITHRNGKYHIAEVERDSS